MAATTTEYGKPMILYSDKASVFRVNNKHATTGLGDTQFARAMRCLNITPLCAETSQAKGRVERAHLTLQDRLVKELRLKGICTIEVPMHLQKNTWRIITGALPKNPCMILTRTGSWH